MKPTASKGKVKKLARGREKKTALRICNHEPALIQGKFMPPVLGKALSGKFNL